MEALEMMDMLVISIMIMVSLMYAYVDTINLYTLNICGFYITSITIKQKEKERWREGERQRMKERGKKGRRVEEKKE